MPIVLRTPAFFGASFTASAVSSSARLLSTCASATCASMRHASTDSGRVLRTDSKCARAAGRSLRASATWPAAMCAAGLPGSRASSFVIASSAAGRLPALHSSCACASSNAPGSPRFRERLRKHLACGRHITGAHVESGGELRELRVSRVRGDQRIHLCPRRGRSFRGGDRGHAARPRAARRAHRRRFCSSSAAFAGSPACR